MLPNLRNQLVKFSHVLQTCLFARGEEAIGEISEAGKRLLGVLALLPLDRYIPVAQGWNGRPSKDRVAIARAFVAKAVYNFPTTRDLLDRLQADAQLRRICGWESAAQIPHESTFSRAFAEFAGMQMPQMVHEALIRETQSTRLIGHIARDSTAIETREKFPETAKQKLAKAGKTKATKPGKKPRKKPGPRPKDQPPPPLTRLQRQRHMTLEEMIADLPPSECSIGVKTGSKGHQHYWRGYKLHLDVADGQIPITALLTGASLHDSQVAIPLATMTARRVTSLYDLMDSAYDAAKMMPPKFMLIAGAWAIGRSSTRHIVESGPRAFCGTRRHVSLQGRSRFATGNAR